MHHLRFFALALILAAVPLAAQNPGNLVFVVPEAVDQQQQVNVSIAAGRADTGDANFGAIITNPQNYSPISQRLMGPLNAGIATQLSVLPIASPSSGVIFSEDPATGALLPSAESLGPILTERAETIGKGRVYLGFTRQQFRFNNMEGANPTNFRALDEGGVTTQISQGNNLQLTSPTTVGMQVDLRIDQNVGLVTYGVTNRFDVSAAFTVVNSVASAMAFDGLIHNTGDPRSGSQGTCWCAQTFSFDRSLNSFDGGEDWGLRGFRQDGPFSAPVRRASTGIGDTVLRAKAAVIQRPSATLALGADLRLPTGDELDYHGSGAVGFKPFVALSLHSKDLGGVRISPHFNLGYQISGDSLLASDDPMSGVKGSLPDFVSWSAGAAISVSRRVTFVGDIVGNTLIDSPRLQLRTIAARGAPTAASQAFGITDATGWTQAPGRETFTMTNGAFGVKIKLAGNLVVQTNMLVAMENSGLRDKLVPLFGLGYSF